MSHPLEHKSHECNECHRFVAKVRNGLCFPCSEGAEPSHFHMCRRCIHRRAPSANGLCSHCGDLEAKQFKYIGTTTHRLKTSSENIGSIPKGAVENPEYAKAPGRMLEPDYTCITVGPVPKVFPSCERCHNNLVVRNNMCERCENREFHPV